MKIFALEYVDLLICANFSANESKNFRRLTFDPVTSLYIIYVIYIYIYIYIYMLYIIYANSYQPCQECCRKPTRSTRTCIFVHRRFHKQSPALVNDVMKPLSCRDEP